MNHPREILPAKGVLADGNARVRHPADRGAWVWHPACKGGGSTVLRFSLRIHLEAAAEPLIHVTADQRFQLRCDGHDVTFGPDRCDVEHWTVQSVRLRLGPGEHHLTALVWWLGEPEGTSQRTDQDGSDSIPKPPMAQMTWRPGFLLHTDDPLADRLNTGTAPWEVTDLTGSTHLFRQRIPHYFDVGPSFDFDLGGWADPDASLTSAVCIVEPPLTPNEYGVRRPGWCLHPATLPEQRREDWVGGRIRAVRASLAEHAFTAEEEAAVSEWRSLLGGSPLTIPARTEVTVIWDLENYFCGYPLLALREGVGARIEWDWAEALYEEPTTTEVVHHSTKGNRNEVVGKSFLGNGDAWRMTASTPQQVPALWWRAGRYVRIRVSTGDAPLVIERLGVRTTGYPLETAGAWSSSDAEWDRVIPIFERAFVTAAHETWTDSPYYEQMCYVGDNAMHTLANYAWFSDDRISRRSLELFDWSRRPSGFVAERYPSAWRQESITYSMIWPMMVRDFTWWRDDPAFVKSLLPGLRSMMAEIEGLKQSDGLLREAPGWPFVDWVPEWRTGCGPGVREGDSSILNLHWILALQAVGQIESAHGDPALSTRCHALASAKFGALLDRFWDDKRGLILDTTGNSAASEHAQFYALLTGLLNAEQRNRCLTALRSGEGLGPATIYATFYLLDALYRHGEQTEFHRRLEFWRGLADQGFTSTPEMPEPSRSDGHAWGAHPAWHSIASIAGIRPASPGFRRARIAPCPGSFERIECTVVHPLGKVEAAMNFRTGKARITLPTGVDGEFVWKNNTRELPSGTSEFAI